MNLTISGHHLEVTPALREYVLTKLDRVTRHFDQVVDVKVLLTVEKQKEKERRQRAECNIHVKGNDMFAESSHSDLYAAVDDLVFRQGVEIGLVDSAACGEDEDGSLAHRRALAFLPVKGQWMTSAAHSASQISTGWKARRGT